MHLPGVCRTGEGLVSGVFVVQAGCAWGGGGGEGGGGGGGGGGKGGVQGMQWGAQRGGGRQRLGCGVPAESTRPARSYGDVAAAHVSIVAVLPHPVTATRLLQGTLVACRQALRSRSATCCHVPRVTFVPLGLA